MFIEIIKNNQIVINKDCQGKYVGVFTGYIRLKLIIFMFEVTTIVRQ